MYTKFERDIYVVAYNQDNLIKSIKNGIMFVFYPECLHMGVRVFRCGAKCTVPAISQPREFGTSIMQYFLYVKFYHVGKHSLSL